MGQHMLTTVDNPYNPFTQWDAWYAYDEQAGYHSTAYLARVVKTSSELSDANISYDIESAIDEIVNENVLGLYTKVAAPTTVTNQVADLERSTIPAQHS